MKICITHKIPFYDVDSMNVVWHGHYFKYFSLARIALFRSRGLDVDNLENFKYTLPIIESHCRYIKALKYSQDVLITAELIQWDYYFKIGYTIKSNSSKRILTKAYTKQAVCDANGDLLNKVPEDIIVAIFD